MMYNNYIQAALIQPYLYSLQYDVGGKSCVALGKLFTSTFVEAVFGDGK